MTHIVITGSTNESQLYYLHMCMSNGKGQLFYINGFRNPNFTSYHYFLLLMVFCFLGGILKGIFTKELNPHANFKQVDQIQESSPLSFMKLNSYYIVLLFYFYIFLIAEYRDRNKAEVLIKLRMQKATRQHCSCPNHEISRCSKKYSVGDDENILYFDCIVATQLPTFVKTH